MNRLIGYYSRIRKESGLSQSELERITGVSRSAINRYEKGKLMPTVRAMNKLLVPVGYRLAIVPLEEDKESRMRKTLICSLIGLVGCTWMADARINQMAHKPLS